MKCSWLITILFCLLLLGGGGAVLLLPQVVPFDQCSDLYKQYVAVEGINATYIKDYKVNDTVLVDVTLLEAIDSAGWENLKNHFEVSDHPPDLQQFINDGENLIFTKIIPKPTPYATSLDTYKDELLAISYLTKTLCVFHIKNDAEKHAVKYHNFDKSTNQ